MPSEVIRGTERNAASPILWRSISAAGGPQKQEPNIAQQLDQKLREGREQGMSEALTHARREAEAKVHAVVEQLSRTIAGLAETRQQVREEASPEIARLAIAIAARILNREITVDPDAIHGLVAAAVSKLQARECSRVMIHPSFEAAIRRSLANLNVRGKMEIVSDPSLQPGEVRFETAQGQLDASIETQLREIERGLADRIDV